MPNWALRLRRIGLTQKFRYSKRNKKGVRKS
jgi:hypothetical protein